MLLGKSGRGEMPQSRAERRARIRPGRARMPAMKVDSPRRRAHRQMSLRQRCTPGQTRDMGACITTHMRKARRRHAPLFGVRTGVVL